MRKLSKKISMLMVLAMLVSLFSGVVSASAASSWTFFNKTKEDSIVAQSKTETYKMESNEFADFDMFKDGKTIDTKVYTVKYETSDADIVWVDAKNGKLRADKYGTAEVGDTAKVTAVITNKTTKVTAKRWFVIEIVDGTDYDIVADFADEAFFVGDKYALAATVTADGKAVDAKVAFAVDGAAITEFAPAAAGEYTIVATATVDGEVVATEKFAVVVAAKEFSAEATGVKEITVYGNFAADAKFTVKKGTTTVSTSDTKVAADGKSAVIALAGKLTKGTYTVACGDLKADIVAEDEKVASIVVLDDGAVVTTDSTRKNLYVYYDVFNQYGESVRKNYNVDWTASAQSVLDKKSEGQLTITSDDEFIYGNKVIITGVHTAAGNSAVVNATVTVGLERSVNSVEFVGIAKINSSELTNLPANFKAGDYRLLYKAYDQMGYEMDYTDAAVGNNLSFTSKTPLLLNATFTMINGGVTVDGVTYGAVAIAPGLQTAKGGVAEILVTSTKTGNPTTHELVIGESSILESFTLIAPDMIIAENDGTIEIPYEAYDQNGNKVTDFRVLHMAVSLSDNALRIVEQNDGSAVIKYDVPFVGATDKVDVPKMYTSTVINTGHVSTVTLNIKAKAVPTTIKELDTTKKAIELGTISFTATKPNDWDHDVLKYYDQYDREMSNSKARAWFTGLSAAYKVYASNAFDIDADGALVGSTGYKTFDTLTLTVGEDVTPAQLAESIEFVLIDNAKNEALSGSAKKETLTAVDITQCRSFSVEGDDLVKTGEVDTYKIKGKLSDGTELYVPTNYLSVAYTDTKGVDGASVATSGLTLTPTYSNADAFNDKSGKDANGDDLHRTQIYTAAFDVKVVTGAFVNTVRDTVTKDITVDNVDTKVVDVKWKSGVADGGFTASADLGTITYNDLNKVDKAITNYGDEVAADNVTITISKIIESENGLYSDTDADLLTNGLQVEYNAQNAEITMLNDAEIGDTFLVSYAVKSSEVEDAESTVYKSLLCTVGADEKAYFTSIQEVPFR